MADESNSVTLPENTSQEPDFRHPNQPPQEPLPESTRPFSPAYLYGGKGSATPDYSEILLATYLQFVLLTDPVDTDSNEPNPDCTLSECISSEELALLFSSGDGDSDEDQSGLGTEDPAPSLICSLPPCG